MLELPEHMQEAGLLRTFKCKLQVLLKDLRDGVHFFGNKAAYIVAVVEFQWRGIPHAHIIYRFHDGSFLDNRAVIELIFTTTMPDEEDEHYERTKRYMTHKCGPGCLINGVCRHYFPRKISKNIYKDEHGFTHFRCETDEDRFVVPHVRSMVEKFDCHVL